MTNSFRHCTTLEKTAAVFIFFLTAFIVASGAVARPQKAFAQNQGLQTENPVITTTIPTVPTQPYNPPASSPAVSSQAVVTAPQIWGIPPGYWGHIVSCTGNYPIGNSTPPKGSLPNCTNLNDLIQTFVNAIYLLMSIALFIIAPILFIVGGIMMITSAGNPGRIETARKTMISAVVGVVIVLCAYLIVNTVITTLHITGVAGFS